MRIFCRSRLLFGNRTMFSLAVLTIGVAAVCVSGQNAEGQDKMLAEESNNQFLTSAGLQYLTDTSRSSNSALRNAGNSYASVPAASTYQTAQVDSNQLKSNYYDSIMHEVSQSTPTMQPTMQQIQMQNSHQNPKPAASNYFNQQVLPTYSEDSNEIYKKSSSDYWPHQGSSMEHMDDGGYGGGGSGSYHQDSHGQQEIPLEQAYSEHEGYHKGKSITVNSDHKPIALHYRTHAQPLVVHQTRIPGPKPEVKHTTSHEEPHRVVHEVIRPIIQEVHEIIQPYRRVVQQVQPVIEEIRTVIAKDAGNSKGGYHQGGSGSGYGGGDSYGHMQHSQSQQIPQQIQHQHQQHQQQLHQQPATLYRKAAVFESDENEGDAYNPMKMSASNNNQHQQHSNSRQQRRSKVYINKQGIPVYESDYMGPAFRRS